MGCFWPIRGVCYYVRQNSYMDRPAVIQMYMDRSGSPAFWYGLGYGSACGFRVWIGLLNFDSQPIMSYVDVVLSFGGFFKS